MNGLGSRDRKDIPGHGERKHVAALCQVKMGQRSVSILILKHSCFPVDLPARERYWRRFIEIMWWTEASRMLHHLSDNTLKLAMVAK